MSGPIIIDESETMPVVEQIWSRKEFCVTLNNAAEIASSLLDQFGCLNKSAFAVQLSLEANKGLYEFLGAFHTYLPSANVPAMILPSVRAVSVTTENEADDLGSDDYTDVAQYSEQMSKQLYESVCERTAKGLAANITHFEDTGNCHDNNDDSSMGTIEGYDNDANVMTDDGDIDHTIDKSMFDPVPTEQSSSSAASLEELYHSLTQLQLSKHFTNPSITLSMLSEMCGSMEMKKRERGEISQDCKAKSLSSRYFMFSKADKDTDILHS